MAEKIKIAIMQMSSVIGDVEKNISKVFSLVNRDLPEDADVLILPEVWTVGWCCSEFQKSAQSLYGGSVYEALSVVACNNDINIIGGSFITKEDNNFYNTCPVFNRNGELIASYSKMHLYSYYGCDEDKYVSKGNCPVIVTLDGVNFGLTICYDIRFPEIYRAYAKAGADILVNCAAWGSKKPVPWEMMTKSRAIENQCYMAAVTQSGHISGNEYNLGQSRIIDYKGEEISSIMRGEGIVSSELDISKMYEIRSKSPTLSDIHENYEVRTLCKK